MQVLVTGGAGFIGSHTCVELLEAGHEVVIADDLSNCSEDVIERIQRIAQKQVRFYRIDVADEAALTQLFGENHIDCAIHFAGFKAVGESVQKPLMYYQNNLCTLLTLCKVMAAFGVKKLAFSSSATVYRADNPMPLQEDAQLGCTNPYGWSKWMIERVLLDLAASDPAWSIALLRYFNPIGAHESGLLGENPSGIPNNLVPYIARVAAGTLEKLHVFGGDYPTPDGTGVRDYIHVVDLAKGHVCALDYLCAHTGVEAFNLGTGQGYSVLEVLHAFEQACGRQLPYVMDPRRPGDIAVCYADPHKAQRLLGFTATRSLLQMCQDAWRWQQTLQGGEAQ